jgi:hypothetical protein
MRNLAHAEFCGIEVRYANEFCLDRCGNVEPSPLLRTMWLSTVSSKSRMEQFSPRFAAANA